jgi:hypothetical protein
MKLWTVEISEFKSVTIYVLAETNEDAKAVGQRRARRVLRDSADDMGVEVYALAERDQQGLARRLTPEDFIWVPDDTVKGGHWAEPAEADRLLGEAATKVLALDERPVATPGQEPLR